jgi:cytidylate kinase
MAKESSTIEQSVQEQIDRWKDALAKREKAKTAVRPVITVSMQPGSRGSVVAQKVAERLAFDYFHRDIIKAIAQSARMSEEVIDTLEKERRSGVDDFIALIVKKRYLHPDTYMVHLMKVVSAIARHGHAVIVGRGANFILPPDLRFSVRILAPLDIRVRRVAEDFGTTLEEAQKRVLHRQSRRVAFIHQAYNTDINDPINYDMVLNTGNLSVDCAVEAIVAAVGSCRKGG